jgi:hypothetical protein
MASTKRHYSKEEFARGGDARYEKDVLPKLKRGDEGKFAAIDIDSGTYELTSIAERTRSMRTNWPQAID